MNRDEPSWLRLRQYVDGADSLSVVLSQLLDAALELEELAQAGYVLQRGTPSRFQAGHPDRVTFGHSPAVILGGEKRAGWARRVPARQRWSRRPMNGSGKG